MSNEENSTENETGLTGWAKILIGVSIVLILFSFFSPLILTKSTKFHLDFTHTGSIGDTIGGIMNPFIAMAGVIVTFLAFYIQVQANKLQYNSFIKEYKNNKNQSVIDNIESQFYEMLRLHKENANEFVITLKKGRQVGPKVDFYEEIIKGRKVFKYLLLEFELLYNITKKNYPDNSFKDIMNEAYGIFYHGIRSGNANTNSNFIELFQIQRHHEINNFRQLNIYVKKVNSTWEEELEYKLFHGHSSQLGHYLRHLYHSVKFIANQPENIISYSDKRKYLRILRSQLSSQEQILIFYNWFSKFGKHWENDDNKYFTDYRMIHNIVKYDLLPDMDIDKISEFKRKIRKEPDRIQDPLFEYQDWE